MSAAPRKAWVATWASVVVLVASVIWVVFPRGYRALELVSVTQGASAVPVGPPSAEAREIEREQLPYDGCGGGNHSSAGWASTYSLGPFQLHHRTTSVLYSAFCGATDELSVSGGGYGTPILLPRGGDHCEDFRSLQLRDEPEGVMAVSYVDPCGADRCTPLARMVRVRVRDVHASPHDAAWWLAWLSAALAAAGLLVRRFVPERWASAAMLVVAGALVALAVGLRAKGS